MEMNLAVKCTQDEIQLGKALTVSNKFGVQGIEIQEIFSIVKNISTEKRANLVLKYLKNTNIQYIAYHYPIKSRWDSIQEAKYYDFAWKSREIMKLSEETIREAAIVVSELDLDTTVPVDFHLFRFIEKQKISREEKEIGLKVGESMLIQLKEFADIICKEYGLLKNGKPIIQITRENNPPDHGYVDGLLDYHPSEIVRTEENGIKNCLDFAHFQQYMNYLKYGKGELPGVDLDKKYYTIDLNWKFAINILKNNIALVHVNDAFGYRKESEGLEVGAGEINYEEVFSLLQSINNDEVIFTIEIKDGHINWWKIENSISEIRKYF